MDRVAELEAEIEFLETELARVEQALEAAAHSRDVLHGLLKEILAAVERQIDLRQMAIELRLLAEDAHRFTGLRW